MPANPNKNTTYTIDGELNDNQYDISLIPSSGKTTEVTVPPMGGATASVAGSAGLVPAPGAGEEDEFLRGDGTWATPTNTDTKMYLYRQTSGYDNNYPLLVSRTLASSIGTADTNDSKSAIYAVFREDSNNNATLLANPAKGTITAPGGFIGTADAAKEVSWSGVTNKPSYYDGKAITSISRNGTTFTATYLDGTTTTFTQQDNNNTYSVATASKDGLVPMFDAVDGTIDSDSTDWVLTNNNGSIGWYKLPANAFKNDNNNSAHSHNAGVGLTGSGNAGISGTYTYKVNLVNETASTNASSYTAGGSSKFYAVQLDKNNKLAVNVPWTDNNTQYSAGTGLSLSGTTFNHSNSIAEKTSYNQSTNAPGYGGKFKITEPKYDAQGHITGVQVAEITMPSAQTIPKAFTITATAKDDDVVKLEGESGSNQVTFTATHAQKGPASGYTSGNTTTSISGSSGSGTIKIPQITVDKYGHVTAAADENVTITMPTLPTTLKNPKALKFGSKTYDGSAEKEITAADLGLSNALHFRGVVSSKPANTSGYVDGDVILVGNKEYVCSNSAWVELGDESSFALKDHTHSYLPVDAAGVVTQRIKTDERSIGEFGDKNPPFLLGIEAFANGGEVKWQTISSVKVGSATSAESVPWSGVTGKPDRYKPTEHTHAADHGHGVETTTVKSATTMFSAAVDGEKLILTAGAVSEVTVATSVEDASFSVSKNT